MGSRSILPTGRLLLLVLACCLLPTAIAAAQAQAAVDLQAAAAEIDRLVEADLATARQMPKPGIDDLSFARRSSLDLIGRIPTYRELQAYRAWSPDERRTRWIDRLIGSSGYVSHQFNRWADLLRIQSRMQGRIPGQPYIDFLKQALAENRPYDQVVHDLLTAEGGLWEFGQTGYYLRDQGMNQDNLANTVQAFLGTRIQCAQCHDHPSEPWTQKQFYAMAAFTDGTRTHGPQASLPLLTPADLTAIEQDLSYEAREAIQRFLRTVAPGVAAPERAAITLPPTYQYADGEPGDQIAPHVLFGEPPPLAEGQDPRQAMAAWMTSAENPRFTTVIANRLWQSVMGRGVIEPVDDLRDDTLPSNPELMRQLEQLLRDLGYDQQAFLKVLVMTRTYQREAGSPQAEEPYRFPGPVLRRMSAEQVWDSLMTLTVPDLDRRPGQPMGEEMAAFYQQIKAMPPAEFSVMARRLGEAEAQREDLRRERRRLLSEAEAAAKADHPRKAQDLQQQAAELGKRIRALVGEYPELQPMLGMNARRYGGRERKPQADPRWRGLRDDWVRASELPQPTYPGHFLRNFGQSDRETIDASSTEGTVVQTLTLLNGVVDQVVLNGHSALVRDLGQASSPDQQIRILFLSILGREPAADEWTTARTLTQRSGEHLVADLSWALVNTNEFLFIH